MIETSFGARQEHRRVVVTGLGVVSSIGLGVDAFLAGLREGRSGAGPITAFDTTGFDHAYACEVKDFDPTQWLDRLRVDELGRASQFAVAAAHMALRDAGMPVARLRRRRVAVAVGTSDGESRDLDDLTERQVGASPEHVDPVIARRVAANRLATSVVGELGLSDVEATAITTACAAGNHAVGYGLDAIRGGDADVALCGGADALCRKTFSGFYRLGTTAPQACRPFDRGRDGTLTGEGAGILVLESLESARLRGARIYAEVLGYGLNCDALHPVAPDHQSIARCIDLAHRNAGVKPHEIDLVSAHGTGTRANDVTEAAALRTVFGTTPPPTISIKAMIGHTMGAAGALAAGACALSITEGFIPPTINHRETDPDCDLDCVPNRAREARVRVVQNNAFAFGGDNVVLVLGEYRESG